ncbi:N-acetylmuramoyl-L-alanine amidase family protein [Clostridium argentinense CDC 2741]|uniref:N-acetylmuramoyl-L-alanine amidase family protein n=1 Tax=Clostridium argentinense CDC 2741 TaxID=1418104 RepID=A0A0C1UJF8_9CLOT|nr:N-acetylmuramoyl-L-alanine amidase [Clostridium argentinense]ARC84550.1 N-acetylmuramoyl-L-alanine amidase [Clostridium argentinense]KIE47405.1 N-acetylmuramoyl-L-alanine amidase family protein [Clostridium argentinense CDC 2741]NFF38667.1 N-acetylmuramoyl-L-alanine amidase [Clostridium argentinense]NFP48892.1 N-acetylmuramoyl-L-alanine amidase [Clostridium argentinense]NFP72960.1 N-acetylmuramoyl-L-alanine amidase [Clostridium argentinense]
MKIGIDYGHTLRGYDTGAVGNGLKEQDITREVGKIVTSKLRILGHTVIECAIDSANSVNESLSYRVNTANSNNADLFISIHVNAGGGQGTEIYTYNNDIFTEAQKTLNNIAALGFNNRGIKDGSNLYVIRNTKAKAMLIELFFIDSIDVELYKKVGAERLANAIVKGITGKAMANNGNWYSLDGKLGIVTAKDGLNVRQSKSTNSKILGILKHGEKVRLYRKEGEWAHIYYPNHGGYVHGDYVDIFQ